MKAQAKAGRFAERVVHGLDDHGQAEQVVIWIERRPGAVWAVGRAVDPDHRAVEGSHAHECVWEGFELEDCLEAANAALEDDVVVSETDGATEKVFPFRREELLEPLERLFFGR
jgi:hypothetical protein